MTSFRRRKSADHWDNPVATAARAPISLGFTNGSEPTHPGTFWEIIAMSEAGHDLHHEFPADEAVLHARIAREVATDRVCFPVTPTVRHAAALLGHLGAFLSVDTLFMHLAAAMQVPNQVVIETPTVNPPILPLRKDWTLIPNPGVGGRNLDFYRYDGRPIAGTTEELGRIMASVSVDTVFQELRTRLSREQSVIRPAG